MEQEPGRRAACARILSIARGGAGALLMVLTAGCTATNTSNVALTTASSGASTPTIAFESIDGPPVGVFNRMVDNLSDEAQARQLAIASREGAANYRVRGYLAAQVVRGRTHISWVWDVYDDVKVRALRIRGEEAAGRGGADPWSAADEAMLRRIARSSMDRLAGFLRNPDAPVEPDAVAVAESEPQPPRRPQRRGSRSAAVPSAAEQLALSAAH